MEQIEVADVEDLTVTSNSNGKEGDVVNDSELSKKRDREDDEDDVIFIPEFLLKKRNKSKFTQFKSMALSNDKLQFVVLDFKKMSGTCCSFTLQSLNVDSFSVPYISVLKETTNKNIMKKAFPGMTFKDTRDPVIIKLGDTFKITSFEFDSKAGDVQIGTIGFLFKLRYSIDFEFMDIPKTEEPLSNGFKRFKGDPTIRFLFKMEFDYSKTLFDFPESLKGINKNCPPLSNVSALDVYKDYPVESRLPGAYEYFVEKRKNISSSNASANQGWVDTFVFPGSQQNSVANSSTSDNETLYGNLCCPYNWTVISNDILFQQPYCVKGYWVYMCNYVGMYEDKQERIKNEYGLQTLAFNIPPCDNPEQIKKKGSNYSDLRKDGSSYCFLRDTDGVLTGVIMEPNVKLPICVTTSMLYDLNVSYNIHRESEWKVAAQHLFRSTAGLVFLQNPQLEGAMSRSDNAFFSSMIKCYVNILIDPFKTFEVGGLRVSKQFALQHVLSLRSKKSADLGENVLVCPELLKPNQNSLMFSKSNGDWCPRFVNVKEVSGISTVLFASDKWVFYMFPDNSIVLDENGEDNYDDNTNTAEVLSSLMFEEVNREGNLENNENYIKENWFKDKIRKSNTLVYAVFKAD